MHLSKLSLAAGWRGGSDSVSGLTAKTGHKAGVAFPETGVNASATVTALSLSWRRLGVDGTWRREGGLQDAPGCVPCGDGPTQGGSGSEGLNTAV